VVHVLGIGRLVEYSVVTGGRGRVRVREPCQYMFGWFFGYTVACGLFSCGLLGEGRKHSKNGIPLSLTEVNDVVHVLRSTRAPVLCIEWLCGLDEVTSGICLVRAFNLIGVI